ncbi:hypothetical protein KY358_06525 [Candidatus Woesearchaeota archaeon]|nr:hypothetical protein [Candidatus Woesearchaeota archaeon]
MEIKNRDTGTRAIIHKKKVSIPKYIRHLIYFSYFYMCIKLLFAVIFFFVEEVNEMLGLFNLVFNLLVVLFAFFLIYRLMDLKRWALTALIIVIGVNAFSAMYLSYVFGRFELPIIPLVYLLFLFGAYKHMRKKDK